MQTIRYIGCLYIFFLLTSTFDVRAQKSYKFELLDVNNGLSHGQVNSILKDSKGYIWIGTAFGLNLYNGYSIKTFTYDPHDSTSIIATEILDIFEGPEGGIWINTINGLNVYDHSSQSFNRNLRSYYLKYNLPDTIVENIIPADNEIYWFISQGMGLTRYNQADSSVTYFNVASKSNPIRTNDISALRQDSRNDIWIVHKNGIIEKIDGTSLKVVKKYTDLADLINAPNSIFKLTIDSDDDLWIYTPNAYHGAFYFNSSTEQLINYTKYSEPLKLNTDLVRGIVEASEGDIWIGTDHGGLNVLDKNNGTISYHLHHPEIKNSLVHNSIYYLYKDAENIIWVGTYKNGVNYYHESLSRFDQYKHLSSDLSSLPFDDVNRFIEDDKGNLWIGTNGGGLLYFDRENNTFKQYRANPNDPFSLSSDVIVSLLLDDTGALWVGTYLGGLDKFSDGNFTNYNHQPGNHSSISGNNIWELFQDSGGNLWIGALADGLDRFSPKKNTFIHYELSDYHSDSTLYINHILAIEEDSRGYLWVGGGGGIDRIHLESGKVMPPDPQISTVLGSNIITSLHHDHRDRMWIGTQEGLYVHGPDGTMKLYTTRDGLPHNAILTILEDDNHNLWFSTPNGISNLIVNQQRPKDSLNISFINYDDTDGLQGKVFNENAALKTRSGELIFGGANGFNIFHPNNLIPDQTIPKIVFTDFQLMNRSLNPGEAYNGRIILPVNLNDLEKIELRHNENVFSIEFAALNFLHSAKNEYKYMLEGFDQDWREADLTRRATYTNLDPGKYTFRVIASNSDGMWNEDGTELNIWVRPPFYNTPLAYTAYALLVLIALYITRRVMLSRERIKYQIDQERREARQMHELDLLKIRFLTNISHEFRTPLSLILAPLDKLIGGANDEDQNKQFLMIKRNARRLLNLVNQLLDFRKLEVDAVDLNLSEGNIIKFIEESVHSFTDLSENKRVILNFNADRSELFVSFDMDKIEKILFNLLSNAFKFTPENGRIDVIVSCCDNSDPSENSKIIEIKVRDTGIGIAKEQQQLIFERFVRNKLPGSVVNQGSGIGLSITREFIKIHGGTIEVESEPEKGTCFTIRIPVRELSKTQFVETGKTNEIEESYVTFDQMVDSYIHNVDSPLILLVEDNEDFRFYLKDNLSVHFKVEGARNGREGWQKCLSLSPDLVVSDLMMPELNGIELCRKVKEDPRTSHIPFVLLTANTARESKLISLNIGADDYITKPFNFEILLSRINNLIQQRKAMQEVYSRKISIQTSEADITSLDDRLIQNAIKIVEENISNSEFSVELLSREMGMSRVHLYKKLLSLTGKTPMEFIRKIRLQRAHQLLEKSQLTISEVAYKVGFNNRKYFTKYFKMEYDILPSTYAAKHKEREN